MSYLYPTIKRSNQEKKYEYVVEIRTRYRTLYLTVGSNIALTPEEIRRKVIETLITDYRFRVIKKITLKEVCLRDRRFKKQKRFSPPYDLEL